MLTGKRAEAHDRMLCLQRAFRNVRGIRKAVKHSLAMAAGRWNAPSPARLLHLRPGRAPMAHKTVPRMEIRQLLALSRYRVAVSRDSSRAAAARVQASEQLIARSQHLLVRTRRVVTIDQVGTALPPVPVLAMD